MKLPGRPKINDFLFFLLPRCLENGVAGNVPFGDRFWLHFRPQNDPKIDPKVEKVRSVRSSSLKSLVGQVFQSCWSCWSRLVSSSGSSRGAASNHAGGVLASQGLVRGDPCLAVPPFKKHPSNTPVLEPPHDGSLTLSLSHMAQQQTCSTSLI